MTSAAKAISSAFVAGCLFCGVYGHIAAVKATNRSVDRFGSPPSASDPLRLLDEPWSGPIVIAGVPSEKLANANAVSSANSGGVLSGILHRLGALLRAISSAIGRVFGFVPRKEIEGGASVRVADAVNITAIAGANAIAVAPPPRTTIWSLFRSQSSSSSMSHETAKHSKPEDGAELADNNNDNDDLGDSFFPHDSLSKTDSYISRNSPGKLVVGGEPITKKEADILAFINLKRNSLLSPKGSSKEAISPWLWEASEAELLRFIRAKKGHREDAWKMILQHAKWRVSEWGADTIVKQNKFEHSVLNREVFWWGENKQGCPTLIVRTRAHDGADYNEDAKIFVSFFVSVLERGRKLYGAGSSKQVCLILDRGPYTRPDGYVKEERNDKTDFSIVAKLKQLFMLMYSTINDNYPDLLLTAKIVPVSWFFDLCFKATSIVMDGKNKKKFRLIKQDHVRSEMLALFSADLLPPHLGGSCKHYGELGYPPHNKNNNKGKDGGGGKGGAVNGTGISTELENSLLFTGGSTTTEEPGIACQPVTEDGSGTSTAGGTSTAIKKSSGRGWGWGGGAGAGDGGRKQPKTGLRHHQNRDPAATHCNSDLPSAALVAQSKKNITGTAVDTHARAENAHGQHAHAHSPAHTPHTSTAHGAGRRGSQSPQQQQQQRAVVNKRAPATFQTSSANLANSRKYEGLELYQDNEAAADDHDDDIDIEFRENDLVAMGFDGDSSSSNIDQAKWWQHMKRKMRSQAHKVLGALGVFTMALWERGRRIAHRNNRPL